MFNHETMRTCTLVSAFHTSTVQNVYIFLQLIAHPLSNVHFSIYSIAISPPPPPPPIGICGVYDCWGVTGLFVSVRSIWDNIVRHLVDDGVLAVRSAS